MNEPYEFLVGIDWATQTHQICVLVPDGAIVDERRVDHDAGSVGGFIDGLLRRVGGDAEKIAVGIEVPRGPLVETLLERGLHVYALNPKQLDRFRDRHTVAGAKDDRLDAYVIADALRTDRPRFRQVALDHSLVIQIRELSRADEDLRTEMNRLTNRLREQIHRFIPHLLSLAPSADEPWFWELVERVADRPDRVLTRAQTEKLLRRHRIRRVSSDEVRHALQQERLHVAPGAIEAARAHIELLLPRLRIVHEQRRHCKKRLDDLLEEYTAEGEEDDDSGPSDLRVLRSLPGVGLAVSATLLAEAASLLEARDLPALRALSGLAPVTKRSGKRHVVVMRYGCSTRLRNAFYHWARTSVQNDHAAKAYYAELRARGHTHGRALRSVADRWLRILMAMLRDRTLYDAEHPRRVPAAAVHVA